MNNSSQITSNSSEEYSSGLMNAKNVILLPILVSIMLTTILGNLLVIISVIIEKSLRTPSNCLIFSLAIADIISGLVVMPLRASVVIFGYWPFEFRCDVPLELNIMTSMASVLHLVAIAIDRYIIVSKIQSTNSLCGSRSKTRIAIMLSLVWSIPTLYVSLPFFGLHDKGYKSRNERFKCIGNRLITYKVFGALITFYIPVVIIIVFYLLIYQIASKSSRNKRKHTVHQIQLSGRQSHLEWEPSRDCQDSTDSPFHERIGCRPTQSCAPNLSILKKFTLNKEEREKKVAKTLTIITSVFLVCWSPYFIISSIYINKEYDHFPNYTVKETVIWLGLCNSTLNPIIYAYFVPTFRLAFKKIIRFKK